MAGYLGRGRGVTQVDGYTRAEADTRYYTKSQADAAIAAAKEVYKSTTAPTDGIVEGDLWYDTSVDALKAYDGNDWYKVSAAVPKVDSISGSVYSGMQSTISLSGSNFLASDLVVRFNGGGVNTTVTVTPTNDSTASVAVPSAVYSGISSGATIAITVINTDGVESIAKNVTSVAAPTGGTITTANGYRIHTFTSSGTFTCGESTNVEYLLVSGGGGGGCCYGGGGGGGGFIQSTTTVASGNHTVTIGAGGTGLSNDNGTVGTNSVFGGISSLRGGYGGGACGNAGGSGGCGGGGSDGGAGGAGTSGQGYSGGNSQSSGGAGGGGAAQAGFSNSGTTGGNGGAGAATTIRGTTQYFAGGGGGQGNPVGSGGIGGGVDGVNGSVEYPTPAPANSGGGGAGALATSAADTGNSTKGGNGGSGIVVVRYALT